MATQHGAYVPITLSVDQQALQALGRRFKQEADGKQLRKELTASFRTEAAGGVAAVRSAVLALSGVPTEVKTAVAAKTRVTVRLSGRSTGVSIALNKNAAPGFSNAGRAFNVGWNHPAWGNGAEIPQRANRMNFFDETLEPLSPQVKAAIQQVIEDMAQRLAGRATTP